MRSRSGGGGRARSRHKRCAVGESVAAPAQVAPCGTGCAVQEGSRAGEERARLRHRWCGSGGNDAPCACSCAWHPGSARHLKLRLGQQNPCITQHAACCGRQCTRRGKGHPGDEQMVRARGAAAQHAETGPGRGTVSRKAPVRVRGEKRSLSQSERVTGVDAAFHSENISHVISRVCPCFLAFDAPTDQRAIGKELSWVSVLRCIH